MDKSFHDSYWAAEANLNSLVSELNEKIGTFDRHIDSSGRWLTARDLYYNYFLVNETNYTFPTYGADGFKRLNINHFRAKLKHILALVTAQRIVPEPIATNTDYTSQAQVNFCKNILRYIEKEKRVDKTFEQATETAIVLGAAFISREWDASIGEPYAPNEATGMAQRKGDFTTHVYNWLDVIFDFASSSYEETNWCILRKYVNRWDLIAKFPLYAEQIKGVSVTPETKRHRLGHIINEVNDDLIPLYTFYHKKTAALPNGRITLFLTDDICLFDGALPYKRVPVNRISADDQIDSPFSYTVAMDLLPLQKVYNALCSAVCTNQAAFGVQNVLVPRSAAIAITQLTEGLNMIEYDPEVTHGAKPEALNLLMNKKEVFDWISYLEEMMARISGINDTIQGNPEANLKSGTALAFVASQALTFISPLSRSYTTMIEETWTGIVDILKEYATTPRMIIISGLANKAEAKQFTNKDVEGIDRIIVETGNPLTQTLAGRIQIAQDLLQAGLATKEEYLNVLTTGQLEPVYAYENGLVMQIKEENEALQDGKTVKSMATDNHPLHIREHTVILNSPEVRDNPDQTVANAVTQHLLEHMDMWSKLDPRLGAALGIPPAPQPPAPPAPEGPKKSISYKDLPPEGQIQLAKQGGIELGAPQMPPPPGNGQMPPPPGNPGVNTGRENPNGAKTPGAPNLPGMAANPHPGSAPQIPPPGTPPMPPGSPAINQEAAAKMASMTPQMPGR